MDREKLAEKIRTLRKAMGQNQDVLAANAGVSVRVIKELEGGKGNPTLENLGLVLQYLNVPWGLIDESSPLRSIHNDIVEIKKAVAQKNGPSMDPKRKELFDLISHLSPEDADTFIGMIKRRLSRKSDDIREP